ncbi:MAG: hypothetical protein AAFR23_04060, partial [Pseudomonadota bacterium]
MPKKSKDKSAKDKSEKKKKSKAKSNKRDAKLKAASPKPLKSNASPDKSKTKANKVQAAKADAISAANDGLSGQWFEETFHADWRVRFRADTVLHEVKTEHQHLVIFENKTWGTCLLLDGIFQLTTSDEFVYHEMMAHVPLMAHERPKSALVIGGGDGGVLREVLKHPSIERATLCEIDREVIDTSLKFYPQIADGAFDDPRTHLEIGDGFAFVRDTTETFDAIIVDSSEPVGPSAILHRGYAG